MIQFHKVSTPSGVLSSGNCPTLQDVGTRLNEELSNGDGWTEKCTEILRESLNALFIYDRWEWSLIRAYGDQFKILLNPLQVMCYHPTCISRKKKPIKLKRIFDLTPFLNHLKDHSDVIGTAMLCRFSAVVEDPFITTECLDELSHSPHSLNDLNSIDDEDKSIQTALFSTLEQYGIDRRFTVNYTCHWKDQLIKANIIKSNSIVFQEADAYVTSILSFPNPVKNWDFWPTLELYAVKLYTSISSTALSLFRGVTNLRCTGQKERDVDIYSFAKSINHPAPSVNTIQRQLPVLCYENDQYHKSEALFHLKVLEENDESVSIDLEG